MKLLMENWREFLNEEGQQEQQILDAAQKIERSTEGKEALQQALQNPQVQAQLEKLAARLIVTESEKDALQNNILNKLTATGGLGVAAAMGSAVMHNLGMLGSLATGGIGAAGFGVALLSLYLMDKELEKNETPI